MNSLARKLFEKVNSLIEKLIVVNKGAKNGQVVFIAGGAGSGKGWVVSKFMDTNSYKKFDVDEFKRLLVNLHKKKDGELAHLDLKNPDHVAKLHQYVKDNHLEDNALKAFFNSINASKGLPNILFDITFKDANNFNEKMSVLTEMGYKPENVHIVWVLQDFQTAVKQNQERDRIVPANILLATHVGASMTMGDIINGKLSLKYFNGEMYVVLNLPSLTKFWKDKEGQDIVGKDMKNKEVKTVEDFTYLKLKNAGQALNKDTAIAVVNGWSKEYAPKV